MADNKKSFIMYSNTLGVINQLPDDVAGRLIKHILAYVNDENPITDELLVNIVFEPIKNQLKSDLERYILSKHDKQLSGRIGNLKRWNKDLYDEFVADKITIEEAENIAKHRKASQPDEKVSHRDDSRQNSSQNVAVNAIVDVNDSVIVNANVNDSDFLNKESKNKVESFSEKLEISPPPEKIDYLKFQKFFNDNKRNLAEVKKMTDARKKRISILQKQYGKECLMHAIEKARDSDFLQGINSKNWTASFDWIFTPANFIKILEDNYANKQQQSGKTNAEIYNDAINSEAGRAFDWGKG